MSRETIAKFCTFVICAGAVCLGGSACTFVASRPAQPARPSPYRDAVVIARIKAKGLNESSGIAASRCNPGVLWTHNDSGNDNHIFAVSTNGQFLGTWTVTGAKNTDWEDIAAYKDKTGRCFLYIGDVGDNKLQRPEHTIFRVPEPTVSSVEPVAGESVTGPTEHLTFRYPDQNNDAETIMVEPHTGDIYVLTKRMNGPSGVYRLKGAFDGGPAQTAAAVAQLSVPAVPNGYLTGGDISPDGRRVIICDYTQAYEYEMPSDAASFDDVWKREPAVISLGKRSGGEAIGYSADGNSIFATSEGGEMPLIHLARK